MKKTNINLIPDIVNTTPDYYCTWQTQLYATSDGKPEAQRACITEKALFINEQPFGWAHFYPEARSDLFFVMDDSWDVPLKDYKGFYGCMVLNDEKFPSYADCEEPDKAYKALSNDIKKLGWKGLGGWVCAQESPLFLGNKSIEQYWKERLLWAQSGGLVYWKVDWGNNGTDPIFRKNLTDWAHEIAPDITIENAITNESVAFSDVFRSYDVPAIFSIPMTMEKLENILKNSAESGYNGLINCEDEVYIAAALGCSFGVMRHSFEGKLPSGAADMAFPNCHRNLKARITEVTRAARWHRIAPAFSVNEKHTYFSTKKLTDMWNFEKPEEEIEQWWPENLNVDLKSSKVAQRAAISAISRNMHLPEISGDENIPFVVCSKNPNGVVSIATLGRTFNRDFYTPLCDVTIDGGTADTFGIFGFYKNLIIKTGINTLNIKILAQDLAGDASFDITDSIIKHNETIVVPGKIIEQIGCCKNSDGDLSEPGIVLKMLA